MLHTQEPANSRWRGERLTRRGWLAGAAAVGGLATLGTPSSRAADTASPFRFGMNTSTISGQKLPITEVVDLLGQVGYQAIEPWIRELDAHVQAGKTLADLGKRIKDAGLDVPSAIGFFDWCVDDDARRAKALEQARRDMDKVRAIGGTRIAAPPAGATDRDDLDLRNIGERYRVLLELGREHGVVPQVEVWGFSKTLTRLSQAACVAIESGHPDACILPDVYHLHKGGSAPGGLRLLRGEAIHAMHMNDYPAQPGRETITDADRVYPGDGVAPMTEILRTLRDIGFRGVLTLELFNRDLWKQDARVVAKTGLEKMQASVRKALGD